jgi:DNA modification methylase
MEVNKIYNGNSLDVLKTLPDNTIDCCITSPPYWGLRDYGHDEQLGSEKHFKDFVNNLCNVFDEVKRVLKPSGTCFVNLGDSFSSDTKGTGGPSDKQLSNKGSRYEAKKFDTEIPNKCLCLVPERFAIEMIDRGWTLRNQIIWHKPNQMPSSATDRFTVDFEKIFFFVKNPVGYYFEQQLEPALTNENRPNGVERDRIYDYNSKQKIITGRTSKNGQGNGELANGKRFGDTGIRNVRTTWSVNTEPNSEAHFATYPQRLVERMLKSGCPESGIVLDPFFGSGTTGIYALKAGRKYVGIELNPEYVKIAENRLYKEIGLFL